MKRGSVNSTCRWLVFFFVLALSGSLGYAAVRHAVAGHWAGSSNPDQWLKAAVLEPSNADNWYRLGRYRELDFEHGDVPLAISYYLRATSIEPQDALFWMDVAGAYETAGDPEMAEQAFRKAQQDYPISAEVAWRYGNFLLRQNRTGEAFRQIQQAVSVDPKLATLAVSRCWRSTHDVDQIVDSALPKDTEAYWGAVQFFVTVQEPAAAMAVWKRLAVQTRGLSLSRSSRLLDLLIQSGDVDDAVMVWRQSLSAEGVSFPADEKSVIWDGGFERNLMNVGFAWSYRPLEGVQVSLDDDTVHSGQQSLKIAFEAGEKLYFQQIWQYVSVMPNTKYRFRAYIRAEEFNTDSGIRFEIRDPTNAVPTAVTASVVGTQPWSLLQTTIATGPQTHLLRVSLLRYPSELLTGKLEGTVWLDDVSLVLALDPVEAR